MGGRGLVAASMDGGGSRPTFEALEKLASAVEPSSSSEWGRASPSAARSPTSNAVATQSLERLAEVEAGTPTRAKE